MSFLLLCVYNFFEIDLQDHEYMFFVNLLDKEPNNDPPLTWLKLNTL